MSVGQHLKKKEVNCGNRFHFSADSLQGHLTTGSLWTLGFKPTAFSAGSRLAYLLALVLINTQHNLDYPRWRALLRHGV